jgi:hypothetical protein
VAFIEELPGANTQGATLDEYRENSMKRSLYSRRESRDVRAIPGRRCQIRETFVLPAV